LCALLFIISKLFFFSLPPLRNKKKSVLLF
jgi:hypothetical protein